MNSHLLYFPRYYVRTLFQKKDCNLYIKLTRFGGGGVRIYNEPHDLGSSEVLFSGM
jgi:hypothetical protein